MKKSPELEKVLASVKKHLSADQPASKEIGQVWQIIPSSTNQEAQLGVIIDKNLLFTTVVMLRRDYDNACKEGNSRCFYKADETELASDFIAAYWCPFSPLIKSSFGKYICSLPQKVVDKIIAEKEINIEPSTMEGQWFRAECISKSKAMGYQLIALNDLSSAVSEIIKSTRDVIFPPRLLVQTLAAASKKETKELFKDFESRICEQLIKEGTEFGDNIFKEYVSVSDNEFKFILEKDISLIFFDEKGEPIGEISSKNKEIVFKADSLTEDYFKYVIIAYSNI